MMRAFNVDEVGYKFEISGENRLFFQLDSEPTDVYKLRDTILRKLLFLVDEEIAEWNEVDSEVVLPHQSIFKLDEEELSLLRLPEFYPYGYGFKTNGRITSPKFELYIEFKRND